MILNSPHHRHTTQSSNCSSSKFEGQDWIYSHWAEHGTAARQQSWERSISCALRPGASVASVLVGTLVVYQVVVPGRVPIPYLYLLPLGTTGTKVADQCPTSSPCYCLSSPCWFCSSPPTIWPIWNLTNVACATNYTAEPRSYNYPRVDIYSVESAFALSRRRELTMDGTLSSAPFAQLKGRRLTTAVSCSSRILIDEW